MKNVLLIGGGGFVGPHLANAINQLQDYKVFILDRKNCPNIECNKTYVGDLSDPVFLEECIVESKPNIIYYLATNFSVASIDDFADALRNSVICLSNLFTRLKPGVRFIYLGSSAQYGDVPLTFQPVKEETNFSPVSNYGVLKAFEELEIRKLSRKFGVDLIVSRIFNITGPGEPQRMVGGAFVSQLIEGDRLKAGNLFPKRDFLDIRDAANALTLIGINGEPGRTYNICSGESISIREYLDLIAKELERNVIVEAAQNRISKNEINDLVGNNNKLKGLGWKPKYLLDQTIKDLIESHRSR